MDKDKDTQKNAKDKEHVTTCLDFINSSKFKTHFEPVLTNIVSELNLPHNNKWIELINIMKEENESNLEKLIYKLTLVDEKQNVIDLKNKYPNKYHAEYVKQCLKLIQRLDLKETMYNLITLVMQDMQKNEKLMEFVKSFKDNTDWKKMVGMLIPVGARVQLNRQITEQIKDSYFNFSSEKKFTQASKNATGVILISGKITGSGEFKKVMSIPPEILRLKNGQKIEVYPTEIELITQNPKTAPVKKGGMPRISKKYKKSSDTTKKTKKNKKKG